MGFKNKQSGGGNGKYANFKDGKIITKIDGEQKVFTTIEGDILEIGVETATYQGQDYDKIVIYLGHEDGITQLGFPLTSGYGRSFCKILPNINPAKQVEISSGTKDIPNSGGKKYGTVFVSQDGKALKWHYTSKNKEEKGKKLPEVPEIKDSKGRVIGKDTTKLDEFMQRLIVEFNKRVAKVWPNGAKDFKAASIEGATEADNNPFDDLPFDK